MSERDFQNAALKWLQLHPAVAKVWASDQDLISARKYTRGNSKKGLLDIQGFLVDRHGPFFVELKVNKGKLTPEQASFIELARKHGYIAFAAWTMDELKLQFEAAIK